MRLIVDARPVTGKPGYSDEPTFILRIYPENNKEMAEMEWGLSVAPDPIRVHRISNDGFHYAVIFGRYGK